MPERVRNWWQAGERVALEVRGRPRQVFLRTQGSGPVVTLLHGFPASSLEWADVAAKLAERHTVVTFDFLGYGASEKPPKHRYSVFEQADLVVALWEQLGVTRSQLVAYDYGAIVQQELLARRADGQLDVELPQAIFLNAGLFVEHYRPTLTQRLAVTPLLGHLTARLLNERAFARSWCGVFSSQHPVSDQVAHEHWTALREGDPDGDVQRRLLAYIAEREQHKDRLQGALDRTDASLSFLWGGQDPVSGMQIADALRRWQPGLDLVVYDDAGHCPHLEVPDRVAGDLLTRLGS